MVKDFLLQNWITIIFVIAFLVKTFSGMKVKKVLHAIIEGIEAADKLGADARQVKRIKTVIRKKTEEKSPRLSKFLHKHVKKLTEN